MNLSPERKRQVYLDNVDRLIALNPEVFNKKFPLPLKVGIHKDIKGLLGLPARQTNALVSMWCSRAEYKFMLLSGHMRRDINGKIVDAEETHITNRVITSFNKRLSGKRKKQFALDHKEFFGYEAFCSVKGKKKCLTLPF